MPPHPQVATEAAPGVQAAVAGRVEGYPGRALKDLHRARVLVPCALAHVLKAEPQLVSAAVVSAGLGSRV